LGIGTSDGKYFPTEMEAALHDIDNVQLDPLLPETPMDDSPTPQQRARDGSIYNNLKQQEQSMEQKLEAYKPDDSQPPAVEPITPVTPVSDAGADGYASISGELAKLPRITVTPNEPEKVIASDKRGFWNLITGADGQPRYKLFPERILDHLGESAQKFGELLKGDAKLPSKGGIPEAAEANDPEALRSLGAVTDMAGFLILGPGRDAAMQASPVTFQKAEQTLASIENITPASSRGGVEILGSHTHPDPRTLEEQIAEIMRPRSRAEASIAQNYQNYVRQPNLSLSRNAMDDALMALEESIFGGPSRAINEYLASGRSAREAGANEMAPRGWNVVEGGPSLNSFPSMRQKTITFANKDGQKFYLDATQYGDHIGVGMVGSMTADGMKLGINTNFANTIGVKGMRDVLKKVREEFPDAKTISGFRATGARGAKGGGRATMNLP